jgi:hypothetical protein
MSGLADDDVGRIAGQLAIWALSFASDVTVASAKRHPRADRVAALTRAFDAWPKICRGMTELEAVAPSSAEAGQGQDADTQDRVRALIARREEQ